jgi:hypothetical protein
MKMEGYILRNSGHPAWSCPRLCSQDLRNMRVVNDLQYPRDTIWTIIRWDRRSSGFGTTRPRERENGDGTLR